MVSGKIASQRNQDIKEGVFWPNYVKYSWSHLRNGWYATWLVHGDCITNCKKGD